MSSRVTRVGKALSHPLTLLLVGAAVSSLVVPAISRRWQDHREALAVKSELVEEMTAKTSRFLAAIQFARVGADAPIAGDGAGDGAAANDAYKQFLVDGAVIASRLSARFDDRRIATRWRAYTRLVESLYALGARDLDDPGLRTDVAAILRRYRAATAPLASRDDVERKRLVAEYGAARDPGGWGALYAEVQAERDAIAQEILDADDVAI